jgi:hypothetical protein
MTDDAGDIQSGFKIYLEASECDYFDTSEKATVHRTCSLNEVPEFAFGHVSRQKVCMSALKYT